MWSTLPTDQHSLASWWTTGQLLTQRWLIRHPRAEFILTLNKMWTALQPESSQSTAHVNTDTFNYVHLCCICFRTYYIFGFSMDLQCYRMKPCDRVRHPSPFYPQTIAYSDLSAATVCFYPHSNLSNWALKNMIPFRLANTNLLMYKHTSV